jgi:hypothetical protein
LGIGLFVVVMALLGSYMFYIKTGGVALSRVVWHYLIRDLPDKKYSWSEFRDRGVNQGISGFYAYGDQEGFSLWTLSGLKTFTHVPGVSIYLHEDVCAAVRLLSEIPEAADDPVKADVTITGNIELWQSLIKQENLVTVVRLDERTYRNGVDKAWSYSGKYRELNKLDQDACN